MQMEMKLQRWNKETQGSWKQKRIRWIIKNYFSKMQWYQLFTSKQLYHYWTIFAKLL